MSIIAFFRYNAFPIHTSDTAQLIIKQNFFEYNMLPAFKNYSPSLIFLNLLDIADQFLFPVLGLFFWYTVKTNKIKTFKAWKLCTQSIKAPIYHRKVEST